MQKSIIIAYFNNLTTQLLCQLFELKGYKALNAQNVTNKLPASAV